MNDDPHAGNPVPEAVFCTSCGRRVVADARFCRACGAPQPIELDDDPLPVVVGGVVEPEPEPPEPEPEPQLEPVTVVASEASTTVVPRLESEAASVERCPSCGTSYVPGAVFCGECGQTRAVAEAPPGPVTEHDATVEYEVDPPPTFARFCEECGTTFAADAEFCGECGATRRRLP